jgi:hypothetical protein
MNPLTTLKKALTISLHITTLLFIYLFIYSVFLSALHFTLLFLSALHFTSLCYSYQPFTSLHFTSLFLSTFTFNCLQFPSLVFTFLTLVLKICIIPWAVPIVPSGSRFQSAMDLFTKEYFPMSVLCFLALHECSVPYQQICH